MYPCCQSVEQIFFLIFFPYLIPALFKIMFTCQQFIIFTAFASTELRVILDQAKSVKALTGMCTVTITRLCMCSHGLAG